MLKISLFHCSSQPLTSTGCVFPQVGLHEKMDVVWGFTKAHLKAKTIVFLSTCKQVVRGSHYLRASR